MKKASLILMEFSQEVSIFL